ncbi:MAG: hypothetical protein R3202_14110 [Candidatus Competibacterales bacterium]|nr:hypothetical protein [Candidatus Competibacterales bacterium]
MTIRSLLALSCAALLASGCTYVSESLLVRNKPQLQQPPINPIPDEMRGSYVNTTPQSMKNRFSYYGLDHAE